MDASPERGRESAHSLSVLCNSCRECCITAAVYCTTSLHSTASPTVDIKERWARTTPGERRLYPADYCVTTTGPTSSPTHGALSHPAR